MTDFPVWINDHPDYFLRKVAPGLYVGAQKSHTCGSWGLVVDLHGVQDIATTDVVLRHPFQDGLPFPDGLLDRIEEQVLDCTGRSRAALILCEVGRSRSASAAYAMLQRLHQLPHEEAYRRVHTSTPVVIGSKTLHADWPRPRTLTSARSWVESHR